jgi:hypothetical protein
MMQATRRLAPASAASAPMKPIYTKPTAPKLFAPPTPKVSRQKPGKVLTAAEKAAFLASRPDLKPKD